jgi:hypothetical protein
MQAMAVSLRTGPDEQGEEKDTLFLRPLNLQYLSSSSTTESKIDSGASKQSEVFYSYIDFRYIFKE